MTENQKRGQHSDVPREVEVKVKSIFDCFENPNLTPVISRRGLCVGGDGRGPCFGDSGGGLFISVDNKWLLRGITSVTDHDHILGCKVNSPAVYTNVEIFTKWIEGILESRLSTRHGDF
jgi:secreted trypsin-like serine protease